jgi:hypothetical protein
METKYKIHAFYILLMLLITIVLLVSVRWGDVPLLVQYFSFALTLSSLLLAILAIIYSFYSSSSASQSIVTLSNLSNQIAQSATHLGNTTTELSSQISKLPQHLLDVKGKVEETQTMIKEYYSAQPAKKLPDQSKLSDDVVDRFLNHSSFTGLLLLFGCSLALSKTKEFILNLPDFSAKTLPGNGDYMYGFIVAASSIGLVSGFGPIDQYKLTSVNPRINSLVKPGLLKLGSEKEEATKTVWLSYIQAVETYFLGTPTGAA